MLGEKVVVNGTNIASLAHIISSAGHPEPRLWVWPDASSCFGMDELRRNGRREKRSSQSEYLCAQDQSGFHQWLRARFGVGGGMLGKTLRSRVTICILACIIFQKGQQKLNLPNNTSKQDKVEKLFTKGFAKLHLTLRLILQ